MDKILIDNKTQYFFLYTHERNGQFYYYIKKCVLKICCYSTQISIKNPTKPIIYGHFAPTQKYFHSYLDKIEENKKLFYKQVSINKTFTEEHSDKTHKFEFGIFNSLELAEKYVVDSGILQKQLKTEEKRLLNIKKTYFNKIKLVFELQKALKKHGRH